jgi:hypothetical protein
MSKEVPQIITVDKSILKEEKHPENDFLNYL